MYVFDTSPLSELFRSYYRSRFPTLWELFDELVQDGLIISTREVAREMEKYSRGGFEEWMKQNKDVFSTPTVMEAEFVRKIYEVERFRQNIEYKKIQKGGFNADPFVIAKAAVNNAIVVTLEIERPGAVGIPNICRHFGIECFNLEDFMEAEGWEF